MAWKELGTVADRRSYSTARDLMWAVPGFLTWAPGKVEMDEPYLKVLQMIQEGTLSAEEGERLLDALESTRAGAQTSGQPSVSPQRPPIPPENESPPEPAAPAGAPGWWRIAWVYVLALGVVLLAAGGLWVGWLARGNASLGWLGCAVPLILLGTLVVLLAWWSRVARWLHLHVRDEERDIRISMPLPLRLAAWVLRWLRPWVPGLRTTAVDELLLAMAGENAGGNVLVLEVEGEEDGEQVHLSIG